MPLFHQRMIELFSKCIPIFCMTRSERLLGMAVNEYTVLKGKLSLA